MPTTRPGRGRLIEAHAASRTGTALEYYDFAVYSAAAVRISIILPPTPRVRRPEQARLLGMGGADRPAGRQSDANGVLAVPVFCLMPGSASMALLILGVVVGPAFHALMCGPEAAYIVEQFDIHLRHAGSSLAYTLAGVVGGAIAPPVFTVLPGWSGSRVPIAPYLAGCAVAAVVGLLGRDPQPAQDQQLLATTAHPA